MIEALLVQDLTIILIIAAIVSFIFHRASVLTTFMTPYMIRLVLTIRIGGESF